MATGVGGQGKFGWGRLPVRLRWARRRVFDSKLFRALRVATACAVLVVAAGESSLVARLGTPPQITEISFPEVVLADGKERSGRLVFKDAEGDAEYAELITVKADRPDAIRIGGQALDKGAVRLSILSPADKQREGQGIILLKIVVAQPQQVRLSVVVVDRAGNRSSPLEFGFRATGTLPDLVAFVEALPARVQLGQELVITATVRNVGGVRADAFRVGLYLSPDASITREDFLLGQHGVSELSVEASVQLMFQVRLSEENLRAGLGLGDLFLGVVADDLDQLDEEQEANNMAGGAIRVEPGPERFPMSETSPVGPLGLALPRSELIRADIRSNKMTYEVGESVQITFSISTVDERTVYAYVFHIDATGAVWLIFPSPFSPDPKVEANRDHVLPDKPTYSLRAAEPLGTDTIQIITTSSPIDLRRIGVRQLVGGSFPRISANVAEAQRLLAPLVKELAEADHVATAWTQFDVVAALQPVAMVTIDRGCGASYKVGGLLTIRYMVTASATATLVHVLEDGRRQTIFSGKRVEARVWYVLNATVTLPLGIEQLLLEAITDQGVKVSAECRFTVVSASGSQLATAGFAGKRLASWGPQWMRTDASGWLSPAGEMSGRSWGCRKDAVRVESELGLEERRSARNLWQRTRVNEEAELMDTGGTVAGCIGGEDRVRGEA